MALLLVMLRRKSGGHSDYTEVSMDHHFDTDVGYTEDSYGADQHFEVELD